MFAVAISGGRQNDRATDDCVAGRDFRKRAIKGHRIAGMASMSCDIMLRYFLDGRKNNKQGYNG